MISTFFCNQSELKVIQNVQVNKYLQVQYVVVIAEINKIPLDQHHVRLLYYTVMRMYIEVTL